MIREGPGGSLAVHAPLAVVVAVAAVVKCPSPFDGAVRMCTGALAMGTPWVVTSRPCIVNGLPYGTSLVVMTCKPRGRHTVVSCQRCGPVLTSLCPHRVFAGMTIRMVR